MKSELKTNELQEKKLSHLGEDIFLDLDTPVKQGGYGGCYIFLPILTFIRNKKSRVIVEQAIKSGEDGKGNYRNVDVPLDGSGDVIKIYEFEISDQLNKNYFSNIIGDTKDALKNLFAIEGLLEKSTKITKNCMTLVKDILAIRDKPTQGPLILRILEAAYIKKKQGGKLNRKMIRGGRPNEVGKLLFGPGIVDNTCNMQLGNPKDKRKFISLIKTAKQNNTLKNIILVAGAQPNMFLSFMQGIIRMTKTSDHPDLHRIKYECLKPSYSKINNMIGGYHAFNIYDVEMQGDEITKFIIENPRDTTHKLEFTFQEFFDNFLVVDTVKLKF